MYIDSVVTPAGRFTISVNGKPVGFSVEETSPYTFYDLTDLPVPILACYQASIRISELSVGDIVEAGTELGSLVCDGGGERMLNVVGVTGNYVVGIGTTDMQEIQYGYHTCQLPYENTEMAKTRFLFEIVDAPQKYSRSDLAQSISFVIAWESTTKGYAWDIVSFMTS